MSYPLQIPATGMRIIRHTGDVIRFELELADANNAQAWLRTNIGYGGIRRREIIDNVETGSAVLARDWHDLPMRRCPGNANRFEIDLPLAETGRFEAKAYAMLDGQDKALWPQGDNIVIKVEPADFASANTLYCAFVRQFANTTKTQQSERDCIRRLDNAGYNVIPRSGTFRDLIKQLDSIINDCGFRIVQLLPIHPVPTTYARMGRFGSPFACLDFMDIDPALAEFDRLTTPLDQFHELADAVHARHARLFIDIPINHTGWASWLQIHHPEWFARNQDRSFQSPGAWGVTWEDLSKLDYSHRELWQYMAEVFLYWCRQGVDGFRCDAGYMVPVPVWEYITARVREEYPDTIFMLEGLGGKIATMLELLDRANLDWAYSELFQNYDQQQIEGYFTHADPINQEHGILINFAETHDNNRLAAVSRDHARMRTALAALFSQQGAFGITNGLEWLATEKIDVHELNDLSWNSENNLRSFIGKLNNILIEHPCYQPGCELRLVQKGHYNTLALRRSSPDGRNRLLILVNLSETRPGMVTWDREEYPFEESTDLLSNRRIVCSSHGETLSVELGQAAAICLTPAESPDSAPVLHGALPYLPAHVTRRRRFRALAVQLDSFWNNNAADDHRIDEYAAALRRNPRQACALISGRDYPQVVLWQWPRDKRRTVLLPPNHALLIQADTHFIAEIRHQGKVLAHHKALPRDGQTWFTVLAPPGVSEKHATYELRMTVFDSPKTRRSISSLLALTGFKDGTAANSFAGNEISERDLYAICTNSRGALSQVRGAWGSLESIYDAMLAANTDAAVPVDRHIMLTRCRAWLVFRDYFQEINLSAATGFSKDETGRLCWNFALPCGMGNQVPLCFVLRMVPDENRIELSVKRAVNNDAGSELAAHEAVDIIIRPDIEDRNFHHCTKAYLGAESEWPAALREQERGFVFTPSSGNRLSVTISSGDFVTEPEWQYNVPHPVEAERGLESQSDLFSPGYFKCSLKTGETTVLSAIVENAAGSQINTVKDQPANIASDNFTNAVSLKEVLQQSIHDFIVRRDDSSTVIAGYPWFLDWGRDTLICLRGIIAAGQHSIARDILLQFAGFESKGTLPNMIRGNDDSNRDTSDAPLWFFVAAGDLINTGAAADFLHASARGRTVSSIVASIVKHYIEGTPNGIKMDKHSGLIFSPAHFTWMDTNHPAATPREGYPIEIQALWHAALQLLAKELNEPRWAALAEQVRESIQRYFVLPGQQGLADCLHCAPGTPAGEALADDACRSNQLLAVTLGAIVDKKISAGILEACEELLVPGAIRSLADRPVKNGLPVYHDGRLLNDPFHPYWGHYRGDEDTRRKPAYHNGTAWVWPFPSYCEAMFMTGGEELRQPALDILGSSTFQLNAGCLGHLPEIVEGNSPHRQRGCGAQAWSVSEVFRVINLLDNS